MMDSVSEVSCIICRGTSILGDIVTKDALICYGDIDGNITGIGQGTTTIYIYGTIIGNIESNNVIIYGQVYGNIKADNVVVHPSASVKGNIQYYTCLEIKDSSIISGKITKIGHDN